MAEWMNIQQNNTQCCVDQRTMIANTTLDSNSGNGGCVRSPTILNALKRALQEMLGSNRWYGTMPKECMIAWVMETTDLEEMTATGENKAKRERKKTKERAKKTGKENAELRRRTKAMAIAYYVKEAEYYIKEREYYEEQYDDEQCAYYHQNHIEEMLNAIRKRLYQRSQNQPGHQGTVDGRRKCSYEGIKRKNKRRRSRSPFTRWSNSKSKRRRTTRRGGR
jgi:hypothetical protein